MPILILDKVINTVRYMSTLGTLAGMKWYLTRYGDLYGLHTRPRVSIRPNVVRYPIIARTLGSSDLEVFEGIFVRRELGFVSLLAEPPPRFIVDLGANVGFSSVFFLTNFPEAFVLAVEPDPRNAEICEMNFSPYKSHAKVVRGAAWHSRGRLALSRGTFGDGREWATEVRPTEVSECADVEAWDMSSLLDLYPKYRYVDLLKIDIEGSETELFSVGAERWLDRIRNICVEVHGASGHLALWTALKDYEFEYRTYGQYTLCLNIRPKWAPFSQ